MALPKKITRLIRDYFGYIIALTISTVSYNRSVGILDLYVVIAWIIALYFFSGYLKPSKEEQVERETEEREAEVKRQKLEGTLKKKKKKKVEQPKEKPIGGRGRN